MTDSPWTPPSSGTTVTYPAPLPRSGVTPVTAARAAELEARRHSSSPDVRALQAASDRALGAL